MTGQKDSCLYPLRYRIKQVKCADGVYLPTRTDLKDKRGIIIRRGAKNSVLVAWDDGTCDVTNKYAVRRVNL